MCGYEHVLRDVFGSLAFDWHFPVRAERAPENKHRDDECKDQEDDPEGMGGEMRAVALVAGFARWPAAFTGIFPHDSGPLESDALARTDWMCLITTWAITLFNEMMGFSNCCGNWKRFYGLSYKMGFVGGMFWCDNGRFLRIHEDNDDGDQPAKGVHPKSRLADSFVFYM